MRESDVVFDLKGSINDVANQFGGEATQMHQVCQSIVGMNLKN